MLFIVFGLWNPLWYGDLLAGFIDCDHDDNTVRSEASVEGLGVTGVYFDGDVLTLICGTGQFIAVIESPCRLEGTSSEGGS